MFLWNLLLALVWSALSREFTARTFVIGYALGYLVLLLSQRALQHDGYLVRVRRVFSFALFFMKELLVANLKMAAYVLSPGEAARPAIVAVPLEARTDLEITLLANFITLTPGSLSLTLSSDRRTLYIHAMFTRDLDQFRRDVQEGFERRLLEILR